MKSLGPFFSQRAFGCIGAVVLGLVVPGCPSITPPNVALEIIEVLPFNPISGPDGDENNRPGQRVIAVGGVYSSQINFRFLASTNPNRPFDEIEVEIADFDGKSPEGVTVAFASAAKPTSGVPNPQELGASLFVLIDPNAPPRPFHVSIKGTTADGFSTHSDSFPFYVHREGMGPAPRITEVSAPPVINRGSQATISITGTNFEGATLVLDDPTITVTATSFEPSTGTLTATIDVPAVADTGFSEFHIETPAGGSTDHVLLIKEARPLQVIGVYPNYAVTGPRSEFTLAGDFFHTGMSVASVPDSSYAVNPPAIVDRHNLRVLVQTDQVLLGSPSLRAKGIGGADSIVLASKFRGFKGPRIARVSPQQIVAGTRDVQIQVEGVNFDTQLPTAFGGLQNETVGNPFLTGDGRRVLPRSQTAGQSVVLLAQPNAAARLGPFDLFIETADGLTTNVVQMEFVAPPAAPQPFAARAQMGRIARDGVARPDVIFGERLTGVRRVDSRTPGLEVVSFTETAEGTSLNVMVRASATTPLSGDARTVFTVITNQGRSNEVGYLVEASGVMPGGPRLDAIFPNFVYPDNTARSFFTVTGADLRNPDELLVTPPGSIRETYDLAANSPRGNALLISLGVNSPAAANSLGLTVTTVTAQGTLASNSIPITVLDPAIRTGPQILSVTPDTRDVPPDSVFQFLISGNNFGALGPEALLRFARQNDDPIRSVRLFSPSAPGAAQNSVIVQLDIGPTPDGSSTEFAIDAGALVSDLVGISFTPRPSGEPFVSRAAVREIRRGQSVNETIRGAGLLNVTDIRFDQQDIAVSNLVQSTDGGASFTATFTASESATLTGDGLTRFSVEVDGETLSNSTGYIVVP